MTSYIYIIYDKKRLFEIGIPVNIVSKLLGHSKTSFTTDIYISVMPSFKSNAVKVLDSLYSGLIEKINQL